MIAISLISWIAAGAVSYFLATRCVSESMVVLDSTKGETLAFCLVFGVMGLLWISLELFEEKISKLLRI